jgi:nucleoside-diphosphate-sugar epimerase
MFNLLPEGGDIQITFSPSETIPLAHYQDIADGIRILIEAKKVGHSIYNLYSESWLVSDLAEYLMSLSDGLSVTCGDRELDGIPPIVSYSRFQGEFNYQPVLLRDRLKNYQEGLQ